MRRGFKAWCENTSLQYRKDLELAPIDPLKPLDLAAHLGVLVWKPEEIPGLDEDALDQLLQTDPENWSALTLRMEGADVIIVNSAHAPTRRANSIVHELSHLILNHKAARVGYSDAGHLLLHSFDKDQEDEADWLSGALLLPRDALLHIAALKMDSTRAAKMYGVSRALFDWRRRMTGVDRQVSRRSYA